MLYFFKLFINVGYIKKYNIIIIIKHAYTPFFESLLSVIIKDTSMETSVFIIFIVWTKKRPKVILMLTYYCKTDIYNNTASAYYFFKRKKSLFVSFVCKFCL